MKRVAAAAGAGAACREPGIVREALLRAGRCALGCGGFRQSRPAPRHTCRRADKEREEEAGPVEVLLLRLDRDEVPQQQRYHEQQQHGVDAPADAQPARVEFADEGLGALPHDRQPAGLTIRRGEG